MSQNETTFVDEENLHDLVSSYDIYYTLLTSQFNENVKINLNCFKSLVCRRLVECGWMDEVTMLCKEKLKNRLSKGQAVKSITEEDLFNDVAPDARRMLPDTIKRELKVKVQNKLLQTAGYFDETDSES